MNGAIYQSNPDAASDSEFVEGELRHLVVGNRGRLLDARRTPVTITAVDPRIGGFEVVIDAFEDAGARWELPLKNVRRFQFARGSAVATSATAAELERAAAKFDRELVVECQSAARRDTWSRIAAERRVVRGQLGALGLSRIDIDQHIAQREGDELIFNLLETAMISRGVADLEERFSTSFVSNPGSGEFVKGHAIVLAELGLCPYRGQAVRNPAVFAGTCSKARRADHLIARLAFTHELWSRLGHQRLVLYRGMAADDQLQEPSRSSFVSATLSREVAMSHFEGGPTTKAAVLWRQDVPLARVVMTFLETRAMNRRFKEAEAILVGDTAGRPL